MKNKTKIKITKKNEKFILWFSELGIKDVEQGGGKNASLGEMFSNLTKKGINVPDGFAVSAAAYRYFIRENKLDNKIRAVLSGLDTSNMRNLSERGAKVRDLILSADFPEDLEKEIVENYKILSKKYNSKIKLSGDSRGTDVAVRSSAT
ncbi:MAG: PEP/pyruvate-binding domain-containing protein, partial [bacterium]